MRCDKKKYESSQNSYSNWPAQARLHPVGQRSYSTPDSSICHYSVPLSFSFEPVSLPIYSALIQPQRNCGVPLEIENHSNKSKHHKSSTKNRRSKTNSINEVPAIFHTPRLSNGDQQDYTSLPPVNCDLYGPKSSDNEIFCKRRFSDPGIGQMSSDDCSSTRSECSSKSAATTEAGSQEFFSVIKQVNELKESNSHLRRELQETKLELETLKINSKIWKTDCESFKPGALSDAIFEIRNAVKLGEEALISRVTQMLEKTTREFNEVSHCQRFFSYFIKYANRF
ncbi:hypothetical protein Phum_PHUM546070 [Pediculus humanus corporis]|uniref:Uncharacterized protein n=1 Tax=Pediculus humanus subsp. corporis TaxID=121224 RepID=E0W060_PEDHC|nr:uncharacterized protein Phum_PHUM546070 [Pediculus humanus corporis]EEB19016.1 hypothetical protein Phum_PHUM546070 [Pediculus humanus corporis]